MKTNQRFQYISAEYTYSLSGPSTSLNGKHAILIIIIHFQIFEVNSIPSITFVIKTWAHIALHLMKQVQIIHELMKCVASTTLQNQNKRRITIRRLFLSAVHHNTQLKAYLKTTMLFIFSKTPELLVQNHQPNKILSETSWSNVTSWILVYSLLNYIVIYIFIIVSQYWAPWLNPKLFYLHKDSSIGVCMGVNCPRCPLPTNVTSESYKHPTARRFSEERPGKSGDILCAWVGVNPSRSRRPFHSRTCSPPSSCRRTHHQSHCRILTLCFQWIKISFNTTKYHHHKHFLLTYITL